MECEYQIARKWKRLGGDQAGQVFRAEWRIDQPARTVTQVDKKTRVINTWLVDDIFGVLTQRRKAVQHPLCMRDGSSDRQIIGRGAAETDAAFLNTVHF